MANEALQRGAEQIERWYHAALAAVEPESTVRRHLRCADRTLTLAERTIPVRGQLVVVGVGKAAVPMARGAIGACGDLIDAGLMITKDGHAAGMPTGPIEVREASHPVPDDRGVAATTEMLDLLSPLDAGDVVLALISGGGSALLEAPRAPVTLGDLATITELLLRAGAPIHDLNLVRIPLSLVKGGGLRRAAGAATMVTLILSDVLGNDPAVIASGPTVASVPRPETALALLEQYGIRDRVPDSVLEVLNAEPTSSGEEIEINSTLIEVIGDNANAVAAFAGAAKADGFTAEILWRAKAGEAAQLGREWAARCVTAPPGQRLLLGGGEATVTVTGDGIGGRNTEFALAAALELADRGDSAWLIASLATDGQDGMTDTAGAIGSASTIERCVNAGCDPVAALAANDSLRVFDAASGTVRPGTTGTNVNDLYIGLRIGD